MLNFLGIGAQKAGTTWLYQMLREHPEIAFPAGKEVHFWKAHLDRGVDWYQDLFKGNDAVKGEITPAYAILPSEKVSEISEHFPDLRLIYVIRNPIERAWSSARMALSRAEMSFEEASDQWFIDHFRSRGSLMRGHYERCIRTWRGCFGVDQLLILRFESLINNPEDLLRASFGHLGVAVDIPEPILRRMHSVIFKGEARTPIRESLYAELLNIYRDKILSLSDYLQEDFSSWLVYKT